MSKKLIFLTLIVFFFSYLCINTFAVNVYAEDGPQNQDTANAEENAQNADNTNEEANTENQGDANNSEKNSDNSDIQSEEKYYFDKNCTDLAPALRIGHLVIKFARLIIPIIIIVLGTVNLFSAVLSGGPGELAKRLITLAIQVVIAALIFFTPSIVNSIVGVMTKDKNSDMEICRTCLFENNCPIPEEDPWYE